MSSRALGARRGCLLNVPCAANPKFCFSQVAWLYSKYKAGEGGILGDDMGLGKTVQAITLLSAALHKTGEPPPAFVACVMSHVGGYSTMLS